MNYEEFLELDWKPTKIECWRCRGAVKRAYTDIYIIFYCPECGYGVKVKVYE